MVISNNRAKGRGSVFPRGNRYVGVLPRSSRPPHQITADTAEEAGRLLDYIIDGYIAHTIYLPGPLSEAITAKTTENHTTLDDVSQELFAQYVNGNETP